MTVDDLDIHLANADERAQAFANFHDAWGRGLSPDEHLRWRLENPKHRNARWYVGVSSGQVVTGCGSYELELRIDGSIHRACALGEVHTVARLRGRGLAPRLIARVEEIQRRLGTTMSMLYSDISTHYYERLGYTTCPSLEGWIDLGSRAPERAAPGDRLIAFDPARELDVLSDLYAASHAGLAVHVARSRLYSEYLVARSSGDEFLWLADAAGARLGHARLATTPPEVKIRDLAVIEPTDVLLERILAAVAARAAAGGARRVGGWLPATPATSRLFALRQRQQEITMLKPLDRRLTLEERHVEAVERFHEIDHV